ncbi:conserved exported hypothetical protein [uncultured Paludibacter sp.]|uniref:Asl1-like glycosyl hydrolase catalytic domain-containing protein n=1 Tax=uncultured Paludibacter sp. TaxID=497635 RepID=A0A653A9Z2_9BACT|nr:conserved exported hypothetical protein [uncultured Paludibacter sp.]
MRNKITCFILFVFSIFTVFAQNSRTTITLTGSVVTVASYTDNEVIVNGATELHLTATSNLLNNSIVKLNSVDSWLFIDNLRPQYVIDSLLSKIYINDQVASYRSNCRVSIYKHGAVVIPQSSSFQPLTVYTEQNFSGDSTSDYSLFTFNNSLGSFDNKIRSFKLKRGYMVTFATSSDGMGYSRVFIADTKDMEVPIMSDLLDKKISFIRVLQWEWVTKKGWAGYNTADYIPLKTTWRYDWSAGGSTTSAVEYVPIRQNGGWPGWDEIKGKQYVTHVLGFNEPDHTEQSNLTVSEALAQWPNMMKTGLRIGSPACTNFSWLYQFMDSCKAKNYRVDYVAVHAYWGGKSPQNWYNDLKYIHDRTGRPIWITEWNNGANWTSEWWPTSDHSLSAENAAKQLNDIKGILQVLDTASFIERYSIYNWVQDCRAMVLNGVLTPAGQYYADNNSVMAYNPKNEVVPTFVYGDPSLSVSFGTKNLTLTISDPNYENFVGAIVEKKIDDGDYTVIYDSNDSFTKNFSDTLNLSLGNKIRYRVRSKFANGNLSNYSSDVGFDVTSGNSTIQYGKMSVSNVGWNALYFKNTYSASPAVVLGAPTNSNFSALLVPRAKLISSTSRVNLQLAAWNYQNITSLSKEETIPYFVLPTGTSDLGGLKAVAGKTSINGNWTSVTFASPFDTIPVVFANQLLATTTYATTVRVRNITKTGFQAKIQKESAIKSTLPTELISYVAVAPGTGTVDGKKIIVGKTPDKAVSSIYSSIVYGDSIPNPLFLSQMQTCNDDTVTAGLRCLSIYDKYSNVVKQREKSTGVMTQSAEMVGWLVMDMSNISNGINQILLPELEFYPNPVNDVIHINTKNISGLNVEIYNLMGILIKRTFISGNKLIVSDIPPGCYLLKSSGYKAVKFIKL